MKKIIYSMMLAITLLLVGCTETVHYNFDEMQEKVIKIEVVETSSLAYPADSKKLLLTLDDESVDDFLLDLSKIEFVCMWFNFQQWPGGITFWIYYEDGYDYINRGHSTYKNEFTTISTEDFDYLVEKYYYQNI